MGDPTGFLNIERKNHENENALIRINHWDEFHKKMAVIDIRKQASRCMDCGVPFCHNSSLYASGASGCPINNLIPDWNHMLYKGQWREALKLLLETNNFPEFTGRVCPAPCEGSCVLGIHEPPVTIKNHEYSIIENAFDQGWIKPQPPKTRTGKTVGIIGSGPAGLAAADQLNKKGHQVTVYERDDRIGGLLMYGIPNMKLDKEKVVNRRVQLLKDEGIVFKTSIEVGKDISFQELQDNHDSVIISTGSTAPRDLPVEGRDLKGVHFAMEFLYKNTKSLLDSYHNDGEYINAKDKDVIVIGGGDTGTDCVATSLRHGCKTIKQLEILPKPPADRSEYNPWPEYPNIFNEDYGQEEARVKFGDDPREYSVMTKSFINDGNGNLKGIRLVDVEWKPDNKGRQVPVEVKGSEREFKADLVLLAMGFLGPDAGLIEQAELNKTERGNIQVKEGSYTTAIEGVFAAGDCRRGQSLV
ncbi:MAG: glutamate synthase subunit beta, partial [Bacteroidota bacterium]